MQNILGFYGPEPQFFIEAYGGYIGHLGPDSEQFELIKVGLSKCDHIVGHTHLTPSSVDGNQVNN